MPMRQGGFLSFKTLDYLLLYIFLILINSFRKIFIDRNLKLLKLQKVNKLYLVPDRGEVIIGIYVILLLVTTGIVGYNMFNKQHRKREDIDNSSQDIQDLINCTMLCDICFPSELLIVLPRPKGRTEIKY